MHSGWNRVMACAAVVGTMAGTAASAGASVASIHPASGTAANSGDTFDDPKLARERRLQTSPPTPAPGAEMQPPTGTQPPATNSPSRVVDSRVVVSPRALPAAPVLMPVALVLPASSSAPASREDVVVSRPTATDASPRASAPSSPSPGGRWPYAPRMKLGYRRFQFTGLGAPSTATPPTLGPGASQSFESLSLDLYPISWYLRVGLSTQFGWEKGQFDRSGDYFLAESASVGFQLPGRFTPFIEGLAGGGYMRRMQADKSVPTAYWQLGIDMGVEIYFANRAYGSLAVGYLHPANLFLMQQTLMSVKADTWSLKIAIGI